MAHSPSSALQRPDLGATLNQYPLAMQRLGFIASDVAPVVNVAQETANIGRVKVEDLIKERDTARAMRGTYSRQDYEFDTFAYACEEHGAEESIDDREAAIYDRFIDAEMIARDRAFAAVLRNAEIRMAAKIFDTAVWTGATLTTALTTEWSAFSTATPIDNIKAAKKKVRDGTGILPNALVINWDVYQNLRRCTQITDLLKYWGGDDPRIAMATLARVLDIDRIIIAGSMKDTAKEGQDRSLSDVWDDEYAMVCRVAMTNDIREPCIARTFNYTGDGGVYDGRVESYREEQSRSDIIRVRHDVDELVVYTELGHMLSNVTA